MALSRLEATFHFSHGEGSMKDRHFFPIVPYDDDASKNAVAKPSAHRASLLNALSGIAKSIIGPPLTRVGFLDARGRWLDVHGNASAEASGEFESVCAESSFLDGRAVVVQDATKDSRFSFGDVTGSTAICFLAAIPLLLRAKTRVGALCAFGDTPRGLTAGQIAQLKEVAAAAVEVFEWVDASSAGSGDVPMDVADARRGEIDRVRLANIIDAALAGTWELNVQTDELRVNPRWAELIGTTCAALAPMTLQTWEAHTHAEDWKHLRTSLDSQVAKRLAFVDCEVRMRHASGHWTWVRCRGRVGAWSASGEPLWMFGTLFDISIPKETERRLRESEAFLDRTGRVAGVGGWEVDLETDVITFSDETCRMHDLPLGYRPTLEEALSHFPGGETGAMGLAMRKGIESGTGWDLETPFTTGSGRKLWVRSVANVELRDDKPRWLVGALQDVTVRRKAVDALQVSERRFRNLFERSLGLICTHDMDGVLLSVNPATANQLGYPAHQMLGRLMTDFMDDAYHAAYADYLQRIAANGIDNGYLHIRAKDGSTHVWQYENVIDNEGDEPFVLGHAQDVTESQRLARQLRDWSVRDPLTRCFNRRYVGEISSKLRDGDVWGCIAFDLDHFKEINDTQGHERGDEVLVAMGRFLGQHVRPDDIVVRLGGDEFLVLLKGFDEAATLRVADRMVAHAAEAPISFSLGHSVRRGNGTLDAAMKRADVQLYEARARSADRVARATPR